jgi:hypothetical protein
MVRQAGRKWTGRLHSAAVTGRDSWLQVIESVEEDCVLVRHVLTSLPMPLISELIIPYSVEQFIEIIAFYDIIDSPHINSLDDRQIHHDICTNMMKAVLLPCLFKCSLDITKSNFVQELLVELLYVIPNIKVLILPQVYRPNYRQLLVERIQILTELQEFCFHVGCTREILIELSKHCPQLKNLSAQDSRLVDDSCIEHLLKLGQLRNVNVADTSISSNGYRTLLSGLPDVRNVIWFGLIDPVLMNLPAFLPSVRKFVGKVSDAALLVRNCPNITELRLLSLTEDVSDLGELRSVSDLSMLLTSWTVVRFGTVISRLGQTLTNLEMYQVVNINIDDLINYCVVLNSLIISYCHIIYSETHYRELPHFQNLKQLTLRHNWGQFDFSPFLHLYVNLNVLNVVSIGQITDEFVGQIVRAGGFTNLTEFVADHCGNLSMETIFLLIESCPHLTKLGNISSWSAVAFEEFETVLNVLKDNNLSLNVCP